MGNVKRKSVFSICFLLIILVIPLIFLVGCNFTSSKISYQKTICTKDEAISKAKSLLQVNDLYFFDCDFSNIDSFKITDISYNLCVSGYYEEGNNEHIDLNQQADIKIVSNYRIESNGTCFGFSVIASTVIPKMDHYVNNEFVYTNPNIIYDSTTYTDIITLHNNGQTVYQGNNNALEISVPNNFYPINTLNNAVSVETNFIKIEGDINSSEPIKVIDTPVSILTHYKNYNDKNAENDNPTIQILIDYFNENAIYTKF